MGKLGRALQMEKRVAIVTGGGGGLGKATAERLFKDGFSVAVVDRDGATARAVAETLDSRGMTARAYTLDVSSVSDVAVTITAIRRISGSRRHWSTTPASIPTMPCSMTHAPQKATTSSCPAGAMPLAVAC